MLGFDLVPVGRDQFAFRALTYYAERASDRAAFIRGCGSSDNRRAKPQ
jgi:hypothetical protein